MAHRVNLAGSDVVVASEREINEAFVVPQIEVSLRPAKAQNSSGFSPRSVFWTLASFRSHDRDNAKLLYMLQNSRRIQQHATPAMRQSCGCLAGDGPRKRPRASPPSSSTNTSPCSNGDMVPASMFRYGSDGGQCRRRESGQADGRQCLRCKKKNLRELRAYQS